MQFSVRSVKSSREPVCRLPLILALALSLCGCSRLPELTPLSGAPYTETEWLCRRPFPANPWRAVHAIHISGPFGHESSVVGVTVVDPATRRIRAVILSLEGVTLFDASSRDGDITVYRAVPPLNRQGFPEGLMHDVSLIFLLPRGKFAQSGRNDSGCPVCRWMDPSSGATDVIFADQDDWRILQYDGGDTLRREVEAAGRPGEPLAGRIRLSCRGVAGYSLGLDLLEAEVLTKCDELFSP
jgi:hypothetical protein